MPNALSSPPRLRAIGALVAVGLAIVAQSLLEHARVIRGTAGAAPLCLFIVASTLTIVVTWRRHETAPGQRPLEIVLPSMRWWLACVPGILLLVFAAAGRMWAGDTVTFTLWAGGIICLLAAGALQAARRESKPDEPTEEWGRGQLLGAYLLLAALTLTLHTAFDFTQLPAFVEADEAYYAIYARSLGQTRPLAWFDLYMVGMPNMQVVPFLLTQKLFGGTLWGSRIAGVIMGTVGVLCTFGFARRLIGNLPGLTAALLLAAAHTHVHYSRTAQIYIETPVAAAVTLWLFVRAWTGGSMLAWLAAGIALGIGTQTYYASYVLPFLIPLTALGWAQASGARWTQVLGTTLAVEVVALLVLTPVGMAMYASFDLAATRPRSLLLFAPENLRLLGDQLYPWLWAHTVEIAVMFNTGRDALGAYGAERSFVDAVTAAIVPLAAAFALSRLRSAVGWLCVTWVATYLLIGVWLIPGPPTYQRVPTALLFSSIAVAWTVAHLAAVVRAGFKLPARFVGAACLTFAVAAVAANAHFYFVEFRHTRPTVHALGFAQVVCGYAATHTIVDATTVDGHEHIPSKNALLVLECPLAKRPEVLRSAELWDIPKVTTDAHVVLIVPQRLATAHPGTPLGYRIVRQYTDDRIRYPEPIPLEVYELERLPAKTS